MARFAGNRSRIYARMRIEEIYRGSLSGALLKIDEFYESKLKTEYPGISLSPDLHRNLEAKGIPPNVFLTEWVCTLGFQQVPVEHSAALFEGLVRWGWDFLFELMGRVYNFLFPWFRASDVGNTIVRLKNFRQLASKIIHKYKVPWKTLFEAATNSLARR